MKKSIIYIFLILLVFSYVSCKKFSEDIQRDAIIVDSLDFNIPVIAEEDSSLSFSDIKLPLNPGARIKEQLSGFNESDITSIKLSKMNLILSSIKNSKDELDSIDTGNNFGNFQSLRFTIPEGSTAKTIASTFINSSAVTREVLLTTDPAAELKPLLSANTTSTLTLRARKATKKEIKIRAVAVFTVTVSR